MTLTRHTTRQPIAVLEDGSANRRLKLIGDSASGPWCLVVGLTVSLKYTVFELEAWNRQTGGRADRSTA